MLKNIDNLNNAVKDAFKEYGLDCNAMFLHSRYPELSDIQCNELLKNRKIDFIEAKRLWKYRFKRIVGPKFLSEFDMPCILILSNLKH